MGRVLAKVSITLRIDEGLLNELKRKAELEGDGRYQPYLVEILRQSLEGDSLIKKLEVLVRKAVREELQHVQR